MIHFIISYPILATLSRRAFITKGNANNGKNSPFFLFVAFINKEEAIGCINKEAIGAISEVASGVFRGFHMLVYWFGYPNYLPKLKEI